MKSRGPIHFGRWIITNLTGVIDNAARRVSRLESMILPHIPLKGPIPSQVLLYAKVMHFSRILLSLLKIEGESGYPMSRAVLGVA